jgi:O-antigen ligase
MTAMPTLNIDAGEEHPSILVVVGLAVFTFVVVTTRLGIAEIGIVVAMVGLLLRPARLRFPAPFWWAMAFIAWAFITSPFAMSPVRAQDTSIERLKVFTIFLVVINTLRTEKYLRLYVLFTIACFMLFPARGAFVNYATGYTMAGRALWNKIYSNPNDLGAMALLALGLTLSIWTVDAERRWIRWAAIAAAAALVVLILLTQSRGVFIGLVLGFGPVLLASARQRPGVAFLLVIVAAVSSTFIPEAVWTRIGGIGKLTSTATISQADPEGSAAQRWEIKKTGYAIFKDHAFTGVGLGCYPLANARYAPKLGSRDTHDTYLNIAAELGLPGLLLWLGLVASVFRRWWRVSGESRRPSLAIQAGWVERAIIAFLIAGFFGTYSGITMIYLMLGILLSASMLVEQGHAEAKSGRMVSGVAQ